MSLTLERMAKRADRLWEKWDSIPDPYGLPLEEYKKAKAIADEATAITMTLNAADKVLATLRARLTALQAENANLIAATKGGRDEH